MLWIKTIDFRDRRTGPSLVDMGTSVASRGARARGRRAAVIRPAIADDSAAMAAIWNHEVLHTAATTDTEPRSLAAQEAWLAAHGPRHPVLVAVDRGEVVAFGALSPYRPKPSYAWTAENSVYVKDGRRGQGRGGAVLDRLLALAQEHGHRSVIARITASNVASLALHERRGFVRVGLERRVAFKHGIWHDVVTLQRILVD
jgi:L-amino acid N-acyltransferase YncA